MVSDLPQLLKRVDAGDELAIATLIDYFREQKISALEQEQVHIYLKQAAKKSHYAIYLRGILFEYGYGVKKDFDMSFLLMREAASKGNAKATYEVGRHFLKGTGVEKNETNALEWLRLAANSPNYVVEAMYDLACMYEDGLGVNIDLQKAKEWYQKASEKGHQLALKKLAQIK